MKGLNYNRAKESALKVGVVTDSFSTLTGTAASVYGNTDYFREVQNQIYKNSPLTTLNFQRPSATFIDLIGYESRFKKFIAQSMEVLYDNDEEFNTFINIYQPSFIQDNGSRLTEDIVKSIYLSMDSVSTYGTGFGGHLILALEQNFPEANKPLIEKLSAQILEDLQSKEKFGTDLITFSNFVDSNPQTKLSVPPPDDILALENTVDLGLDYRGINFTSGYLSPQQYFSGVAYPGYETSFNIPKSMPDSIAEGYFGYPSDTGLESVFTPSNAESYQSFEQTDSEYLGKSIVSELPSMSAEDSTIYQISLIGNTLGRLVGFDPKVSSNGDLMGEEYRPIDNNADKDSGKPLLARSFSPAFT